MISGPSGILQSFDSEGLRATLFQAFSSQGIHEDWIIDHFLLSIEEKIRLTNAQGRIHLSEQDIHGFVDTLLTASGYSDVAREYIRLCGMDPFARFRRDMQPWTRDSLEEQFKRQLPLAGKALDDLCEKCANLLMEWEIQQASPAFITELAIHLLQRQMERKSTIMASMLPDAPPDAPPPQIQKEAEAPATVPAAPATPSMWLFRADSLLKTQADGMEKALLERHGVTPLPVSALFPASRLLVNPPVVMDILAPNGWLSEMTLLKTFDELGPYLRNMLLRLRAEILAQVPSLTEVPATIAFNSMTSLLDDAMPGRSRKAKLSFFHELQARMEHRIRQGLPFPVLIAFR